MMRYISIIAKTGESRRFEGAEEARNEQACAFDDDLAHNRVENEQGFILIMSYCLFYRSFHIANVLYRLLMCFPINIELVTHILPKLMCFIVEFAFVHHEF